MNQDSSQYNFLYKLLECSDSYILIEDRCVEQNCMSITNSAEEVIEFLLTEKMINPETRVFYIDTNGIKSELKHNGQEFTGFGGILN